MALFVLGLSHKTAPLEVREKLAFEGEQLPRALDALSSSTAVEESLILSTCNRTELYCRSGAGGEDEALSWLTRYRELDRPALEPHLYQLNDEQAVRHALRVASGLDSLVVGEPQILGQLKDAYRHAVTAGTAGKFLNRLMQFSFSTAKLIRTETEIGNTPVSVAYAAVKLAQQIHGDLSGRTALLVGAGETITLVANHLAGAGIGELVIANRSRRNAQALAERYYGKAIELGELPARLPGADIVVCSTASRVPILTRGIVELALKERRNDPMFIVDLAVPRDVEADVISLDDVYLYTVDDLENVVASNMRLRHEAATQAEEMVQLQVQDYMDWLDVQSSSATIAEFRQRSKQTQDELLHRALRRLEQGDEARDVLEQLAHTLTNRLIHAPTARLRRAAGRDDFVRTARELLGLDDHKGES